MARSIKGMVSILCLLGLLFLPQSFVRADSTQMSNEAGIGFENDYDPTTSSTIEPELPSGTTEPATAPAKIVKPAVSGGGKSYFPATGEKRTLMAGVGIVLIIAIAAIVTYRRKKFNK